VDCSGGLQDTSIKAAFHDTDTDILARILADTSDTRDFLARNVARMSVSVSWNAALTGVIG